MTIDAANSDLREIPVQNVVRNLENPRVVFRPGELADLLESIRVYNVQVPISVYRDKGKFVLIDGERRWRCCLKLNKKTIPALIQDKPSPLTNLLLMFNIHSLREQWDLLTVALKLPRVMELLEKQQGRKPTESELAAATGLPRAVIRRSKLLVELPPKYLDQLLDEIKKPKPQQKLTEDFFIEMERSLKTVERAMPDIVQDKDAVREVLLDKYKQNTIKNLVDLRDIAKIARADRVGADVQDAEKALRRLFQPNKYSIRQAFSDTVSGAYSERDLLTRINSLLERLHDLRHDDLDEQMRSSLRLLVADSVRLLEGGE
jgi:ParB family chromosome partitioning protein